MTVRDREIDLDGQLVADPLHDLVIDVILERPRLRLLESQRQLRVRDRRGDDRRQVEVARLRALLERELLDLEVVDATDDVVERARTELREPTTHAFCDVREVANDV